MWCGVVWCMRRCEASFVVIVVVVVGFGTTRSLISSSRAPAPFLTVRLVRSICLSATCLFGFIVSIRMAAGPGGLVIRFVLCLCSAGLTVVEYDPHALYERWPVDLGWNEVVLRPSVVEICLVAAFCVLVEILCCCKEVCDANIVRESGTFFEADEGHYGRVFGEAKK